MGIAEGDHRVLHHVFRDLLCPGNVWLVCSLCYEYLREGHSMKLWRWSINRKGDLQDTGDGRAVGCWGCWCWRNLNVRRETCPRQGLCVLQAAELGKAATQSLWDKVILSQAPDIEHSCRIWHLPCWHSVFLWSNHAKHSFWNGNVYSVMFQIGDVYFPFLF